MTEGKNDIKYSTERLPKNYMTSEDFVGQIRDRGDGYAEVVTISSSGMRVVNVVCTRPLILRGIR